VIFAIIFAIIAIKYAIKYIVKYAVKYIVKFKLYCKIRRNLATFHLNIYSNLCGLKNKSIILGVFW
jgi:hypothetical protein